MWELRTKKCGYGRRSLQSRCFVRSSRFHRLFFSRSLGLERRRFASFPHERPIGVGGLVDEQEFILALCRIVEDAVQSSDPAGKLAEEGAEAVEGVLRHDWVG